MEGFTHERRAHRLNGADSGHERAVYQPPEARLTGTATFQIRGRVGRTTVRGSSPRSGVAAFRIFPSGHSWSRLVALRTCRRTVPARCARSARSRSSMARVGFGAASRAYMSSARNARSRSGSRIATGSRRDPPPSVRSAGDRGKPLGEAAVSDGAGLALRRDRGARPEVGWRPRTLLTLFVQPTIAPARGL